MGLGKALMCKAWRRVMDGQRCWGWMGSRFHLPPSHQGAGSCPTGELSAQFCGVGSRKWHSLPGCGSQARPVLLAAPLPGAGIVSSAPRFWGGPRAAASDPEGSSKAGRVRGVPAGPALGLGCSVEGAGAAVSWTQVCVLAGLLKPVPGPAGACSESCEGHGVSQPRQAARAASAGRGTVAPAAAWQADKGCPPREPGAALSSTVKPRHNFLGCHSNSSGKAYYL